METNDVRHELAEVARVREATVREQYRLPDWGMPALLVAAVACLAACALLFRAGHPLAGIVVAAAGWNSSVGLWKWTTRRSNRVKRMHHIDPKTIRNNVVVTITVNVAIGALIAIFGYKAFIVVAIAYVGYLAYTAVPGLRQLAGARRP